MQIRIFRKDGGYEPPKLSKTDREALSQRIAMMARVQRPELLDFFLSGKFYKLPVTDSVVLNNPPLRRLDFEQNGWTVPDGSLGKGKTATISQANSIVAWIGKHLSDAVNVDDVSVVID